MESMWNRLQSVKLMIYIPPNILWMFGLWSISHTIMWLPALSVSETWTVMIHASQYDWAGIAGDSFVGCSWTSFWRCQRVYDRSCWGFGGGELRIGMIQNKWTHNQGSCGHEHLHGLGGFDHRCTIGRFFIHKHCAHKEIPAKFLATKLM